MDHCNRSRSRRCSKNASKSSSTSSSSGTRSAEGTHFDWRPGLVLNSHYELIKLLGDGTFGRVLLAKNAHIGREVAIKVVRDVERYTESAIIEASILKAIYKADSGGNSRCALMYDAFMHDEKYFCLVFEPLGISLYDFLKANEYRGYWVQDIQVISQDLMQALTFLHGQLHMVHADLKPENILLESMEPPRQDRFPRETEWLNNPANRPDRTIGPYLRPASSRVKLIDFGNAIREDEEHETTINTRQYRGPEVLLALEWDESSDIWAAGCILMELYSGDQMFRSNDDFEHLVLMERIIDRLPQWMIDSTDKKSYLTHDKDTLNLRLCWPDRVLSPSSERHVRSQKVLQEQVLPEHKSFAEFIGALLRLEPCRRLRAINATIHPFFQTVFEG